MLSTVIAYREPGTVEATAREAVPAVVICGRCGVVAPEKASRCAVCEHPLAETRAQLLSPSEDTFWVAVRCAFRCNSCQFLAPLDGLDASDAVSCAHCGLRQHFELASWLAALDAAHAVGDLAGPHPEGRSPHAAIWVGSDNPYASIGDTETFTRAESGVLSAEASPGHPVCRSCHVALVVTVNEPGAAHTRCPRCAATATYTLPSEARRLHSSLVALVSDEQRTDCPRARTTESEGGVIALHCPGCGAPLDVASGARIAACPFCKATCLIPTRVHQEARTTTPKPAVWWLLFQGASSARRMLEAPVAAPLTTNGTTLKKLALRPAETAPIGDAPGVYAAPEIGGLYLPQLALTAAVGTGAALVGLAIYEFLIR